jgi:ribosomal protein L29
MTSKLNTSELREKSVQDLRGLVTKLTKDYVILKMQTAAGHDKVKTHRIGNIRVQIAQIKTILRERRGAEA